MEWMDGWMDGRNMNRGTKERENLRAFHHASAYYGTDRTGPQGMKKGTDGTGHEMILAMASTRKTDGISYKTGFFLLFIKDEYA